MNRILSCAAIAAAIAVQSPACAATFEFYEGNGCTQSKLGSIDTNLHEANGEATIAILNGPPSHFFAIPFPSAAPWNDEARSVRVSTNWHRVREPKTARVAVYDNPDAKTDDDWAVIVVTDATRIPADGLCIDTFERNFDRDGVYLERHPKNGLDGKISYVASTCAARCQLDLTPDPAATKPRVLLPKIPPRIPASRKIKPL